MKEEDGILREFLVECAEGLGRLDQEFVALEKETTNTALIASIFRTIHTIKGTCGFLGLPRLENVAHGAEDLLSMMRDGKMPVTPDGVTILLEAVDSIKEILAHIESNGSEPDKDYDTVRKKLDTFLGKESGGQESVVRMQDTGCMIQDAGEKNILNSGSRPLNPESSIRVDVGLLDRLMNLVGELVLARNQLLQRVREKDDTTYAGTAQRMNLITTELQDAVMKTRMQPIRNLWDKFPRLVRDLTRANSKEVEIVMEGAETELDRTLLEAIKDPLTHIVRNSVDHGIEMPDLRRAMGKETRGILLLKAFHEGGQINIEIMDDGGGIDTDKVKHKAVEKGLVSAEAISHLSERELLNLIFLPGLSTAEKVTSISGRGVGMDVVKTNIEKIGGTIELSSYLGQGTTIKIKIPLTLAIIPALMVTVERELFAIPQAGLIELVRLDEGAGERIEVIHGASFYRLRGTLLPILYLNRLLHLKEERAELSVGRGRLHPALPVEGDGRSPLMGDKEELSDTNIVILKAGDRPFGLVVHRVNDSEEIVVKPLSKQLKGLSIFAGATIMGDGRVALILDVVGIAKEGGLLQARSVETSLKSEDNLADNSMGERQMVVLFSVSRNDRFAVPLTLVARLEEFDQNKIEQAAGREVIQYLGGLLPLIRLDKALGVDFSLGNGDALPIIVFSRNKKNVGIVVGRILDIIETEALLHPPPAGKAGVAGSLVIDGATTDLLDIDQVIEMSEPGWAAGGGV